MANVQKKGFTLIEIMVVVAIVAILAALALPAFLDSVRKSRRSEGMDTLMDIHLTQERYRVNNPDYGAAGTVTTVTPGGYYSVALIIPSSPNNATNYSIVATPQSTQAKDSCPDFTLAVSGGTITKTTGGVANPLCWRQ